MTFSSEQFLPSALMAKLTATRIDKPDYALRAAHARTPRKQIAPTGKLNIIAADHPARRVTKVGNALLAMADRQDYLARTARVLSSPRVDGVMATMDILEDLLAIDGFLRDNGTEPLLDGKLLIASLNRGGLAGTSWELDDPITGATPHACREWMLDGAKFLLRVDDAEPASLKTMLAAAEAINECNALKLPMFLEPLPVEKKNGAYTVTKSAEALAKLAGVASALGDSSRYLWLKLPYCDNFDVVARSTTLPVLLLGGESAGDPTPFLAQMASALNAGANVRGALVGRNVLYPGPDDPLAMAEAVGAIVHGGADVNAALAAMSESRGTAMERLARAV